MYIGDGLGVKFTTLFHSVIGVYTVLPHILLLAYPLVNSHITMENHTFSWENSLFLWPCSIAFCMFTRPGIWFLDFAIGNIPCFRGSHPTRAEIHAEDFLLIQVLLETFAAWSCSNFAFTLPTATNNFQPQQTGPSW